MTNAVLKEVVVTPDGKMFDSKAEALAYMRLPVVKEAFMKLTENDAELTQWLMDNQEIVEVAFETGTIRRVSKAEHAKLLKALEALKAVDDTKLAFLQENAGAIADSFRWPTVKRMTDEEKAVAARNSLVGASGNEELAAWVLQNREAVLEAYKAGVPKREVSPKATEALLAYRKLKAAEKKAAEDAAAEKASAQDA